VHVQLQNEDDKIVKIILKPSFKVKVGVCGDKLNSESVGLHPATASVSNVRYSDFFQVRHKANVR